MSRFDGVVDFASGAEIIRRVISRFKQCPPRPQEVEEFHTLAQRRFIISGLAIISATMACDLDGRK